MQFLSDLMTQVRQYITPATPPAPLPDDLQILDTREAYDAEHRLEYYAYELRVDGRPLHRVVRLQMLTYLPHPARTPSDILTLTRKVLKGLTSANVDFVYLVAGICDPPLGITQCYGVLTTANDSETALQQADAALSALAAAMANFEQVRLEPLDATRAKWLSRAFDQMRFATAIVGHPDPREPVKIDLAGVEDGRLSPFSVQQNEMLFRGMIAAQEEFVNVVIGTRVPSADVFRLQERVAQEASRWASMEKFTRSVHVGFSLPLMLSGALGDSAANAYSNSHAHATSDAVGESYGTAHSDGITHSESDSRSESSGRTWGSSESQGIATTHSVSQGHSDGRGHTVGATLGSFQSRAVSDGVADTQSWSHTEGQSSSASEASGWSESQGQSMSQTDSADVSVNAGVSAAVVSAGASASAGQSWTEGQSATAGVSGGATVTHGGFSSDTVGGAHTVSHAVTQAHGTSRADSTANSTNSADSETVSSGVTHSSSRSTSQSQSQAETNSHGTGVAHSSADTDSHGTSQAHGTSDVSSASSGQSLGISRALGLGAGLAPSLSLGKAYQGEDHTATLVAIPLRQQEALLHTVVMEGGLLVDNYVLTRTAAGRRAIDALVPQAFHGTEEVITPVRTRVLDDAEQEYIRQHTRAFLPSARAERNPWLLEPWKDTTLLTLLQTAAYVAPGVFEQGAAITVQERIPPFAFYPSLPGNALLGKLYSAETGHLTAAEARLARERMSNWGFFADTRFGKSVAAERLVVEAAQTWGFRTIVLDFGAGWRKLLNVVPHNTLYGLYPGSPRPLRWNPLQVGRRIPPERQLSATCELFVNAGRMGPRQHGFLRRALRALYTQAGVLVADPQVLADPLWNNVRPPEADLLNAERARLGLSSRAAYTPLAELEPWERQALAVARSKAVDIDAWVRGLRALYDNLPKGDQSSRSSLEGVLVRLEPLSQGEQAAMFGKGADAVALEDLLLTAGTGGVAVLEGGEMDEYAKSAILGLIAWHLYTDAVVRRRQALGRSTADAPLLIVFEEGNKIISGVASAGSEDGPASTTEIFQSMFRDAGKYNIFLSVIAQSPSELPPGILSSCNNLMVGQLKNARDRDVALAALGRSEKGFWYVEYATFIERMAQAQMILKLGLSPDVREIEPMLIRPTQVAAVEPSDDEIRARFAAQGDAS